MKTLILNGSPHKNGDTMAMVQTLLQHLQGTHLLIHAYDCNISPCIDCRCCWEQSGCAIQDEMQAVYHYLTDCDNVVIASPIYFAELTGSLLNIGSRFQTDFCARRFRKETPNRKPKKGVVLLAGGGTGNPQKPYETAVCLLHHVQVQQIYPLICSHNTDQIPAAQDWNTLEQVRMAAAFLNETQ